LIKLVVLDLDGTLLDPSGLIDPYTCTVLEKITRDGVVITIATGRPFQRTLLPLRENQVYPGSTFPQFLICEERDIYELQSGEYYPQLENSELHSQEVKLLPISHQLLSRLTEIAPSLEFAVNNSYSQQTRGFLELYFVTRTEAEEAVRILVDLSRATPLKVVRNGRNVCLRAKSSGKGEALVRLARMMKLELSEIVAVGDSHNDLAMLTCGVRPATTANADEEIRAAVARQGGYVAAASHSRGVGEILKHLVCL
jgi:HAD superfamily hydrolase (TIGR01484 family)